MKRSHADFSTPASSRAAAPASAVSLPVRAEAPFTGTHTPNQAMTRTSGSGTVSAPTLQTVSRPGSAGETAALAPALPDPGPRSSASPIAEIQSGPTLVQRSSRVWERQFSEAEQMPGDILRVLVPLLPFEALLNLRSASKTLLDRISVETPRDLEAAHLESAELKLLEAGKAVMLPDATVENWIAAASSPHLSQSISRARLLVAMRGIMQRKNAKPHLVDLWRRQFERISDEDFITCCPALFVDPKGIPGTERGCDEVVNMLWPRFNRIRPEFLSKLAENCISQTGANPAEICQAQQVPAFMVTTKDQRIMILFFRLFALARQCPPHESGAYIRKLICAMSAYRAFQIELWKVPYGFATITYLSNAVESALAPLTLDQTEDIVKDYLDEIEERTDPEHRWQYVRSLLAASRALPMGSRSSILDRAGNLLHESLAHHERHQALDNPESVERLEAIREMLRSLVGLYTKA
jgi:hypothetical protein